MSVERPSFETALDVLERHPLLAPGALAAGAVGTALLGATLALGAPLGLLGSCLVVLGLMVGHAGPRRNMLAARRRRQVRADEQGIWQDGTLVVERSRIAGGYFQPRARRGPNGPDAHGSSVRIVDKHQRIVFEAEAEESAAHDLLCSLGLDPRTKRADFDLSSAIMGSLAVRVGVVVATLVATASLMLLLGWLGLGEWSVYSPYAVFGLFGLALLPAKLTVGSDGLFLRSLLGRRFIPMSQIQEATAEGDRVIRLWRTDGTTEKVRTVKHWRIGTRTGSQAQDRHHRDAALARIREALALHRAESPATDLTARVARGGRTHGDWLEALHQMRGAVGNYRETAVRDEDLWRVVEDPAAPEDARAGAATVLRRSLDEVGKARIRVAAEAVASPKLRVALDATALEQEATEALASFEEAASSDEAPARRRA